MEHYTQKALNDSIKRQRKLSAQEKQFLSLKKTIFFQLKKSLKWLVFCSTDVRDRVEYNIRTHESVIYRLLEASFVRTF
jgi:hypothetical protein